MPRLLVSEARAETTVNAPYDGLGFAAFVDLAGFTARTETPSKVWVGLKRTADAKLVVP
jgi:hypothetical protein